MTAIEIEYDYTKQLARRAVLRYMRRRMWIGVTLAVVIFVLGAVRLLNGFTDDVLTLAFLIMPVFYAIALYSVIWRAERVAARLPDPRIRVTADDAGITFRTTERTTTLTWHGIDDVWKFADVWLFFPYGPSMAYTALPTSALTPEAAEFLAERLK